MLAAMVGHVGIMEQLLRAKAATDAADSLHGWQPLHYAAFHSHEDAVTALIACAAVILLAASDSLTDRWPPCHENMRAMAAGLGQRALVRRVVARSDDDAACTGRGRA